MITMNWVNLATLCIDNEFAPATTEHATTLDIKGVGVMLRGSSASARASAPSRLIERGHSLVADDLTVIKLLDERELMATSRPLNRGYMECRGIGIINIAEMFGVKSVRLEKRIDMVVSLQEWTSGRRRGAHRPGGEFLRNSRTPDCRTSNCMCGPAGTWRGWSKWPR
jgi:HPr kinase/phosphorylase